ncbi:P-loop ATPase, Sll1717 family [Lysinibacillus fusiformis]|uniref:P-loop ATPase, Sll1717 family n=1 Tax=Lysinibacillus sp. PWR01 TaxID=3342384 RepID=UPI00372D3620
MNIDLNKINLGSIDGEKESSYENFDRLFYTKNSKYNEIMHPEKFIISGRKGTGKTILANYIVKNLSTQKNTVCTVFNKDDFKLQKLIDLDYRDLKKDELSLFWKWFFLLQIAQSLLSTKSWRFKNPFSTENKLRKFLSTKYPDDIFKLINFNKSRSKKYNVKSQYKKSPAQINGEAEDSYSKSEHYEHKEYYALLAKLEELVFNSLKNNYEAFLIFDDLDELEEQLTEDSSYYKLIKSMIETINDLNMKLQKLNKQHTKIVVLLRSDILEEIHEHSSNSNKVVTLGETKLYWIAKKYNHPAEHILMDLILHKIRQSVSEYSTLDNRALYKKLFPKKINDKEVVDYLLDYSFGRPRDIIRYLQLIIESNPLEKTFEPSYFKDCAQNYSTWFYHELMNEISIRPNKNEIIDGILLIKNLKKRNMKYQQIEQYYETHKSDYPNIKNLKDVLKQLFKIGVIGNSWIHRRDSKGEPIYYYSWGYRDDSTKDPNFSQHFVVHYGLKKYFS